MVKSFNTNIMKYNIFIITLMLLFQSCYTYKANSSGYSKTKNEVEEIRNPHYIKRKNAIGISVMGLSIAGAGYAGYQFGPIATNTDQGNQRVDAGNIALGLLIGVGANLLVDKAFGLNKVKEVNTTIDFQKWVKKTNDSYIALEGFRAIPKNKEFNYEVYNVKDVLDYKIAFPNTKVEYENKLVNNATKVLNQKDLLELINLYSNNNEINIAKKKYIETAFDYFDLFKRNDLFKNIVDIELLSTEYVDNYDKISDFNSRYPNSKYKNKVFEKYKSIEDNLFEIAKKTNTIESYTNYIRNSPNGLHVKESKSKIFLIEENNRKVAEEKRLAKIQNDKSIINNQFANVINTDDENNIFNFYLKYKNSEYDFAKNLAITAYNKVLSKQNVNNLSDYNAGFKSDYKTDFKFEYYNSFVRIAYKTKDGSLAYPFESLVSKYLATCETSNQTYLFGLLGSTAENVKLFREFKINNYMDKAVICASWYRLGVEKDGNMGVQNSGFDTFKKNFTSYMDYYGLNVTYIEYLGSKDDDISRQEARESAYRERRQDNCNKCVVNWDKTKDPSVEYGFFGKTFHSGVITMRNGDDYSWDYSKKGFRVNNGFLSSDDYYKTYPAMVGALVKKCENKYCY
jgi:hypothetical protein